MAELVTYLHAESFRTSKPVEEHAFFGASLPWFNSVREALAGALPNYPSVEPVQCDLADYQRVHTEEYLNALVEMAEDREPTYKPRLSGECSGLEYALPGYRYTLGGMMEIIRRMAAGKVKRAYAFGLPGHHAHADWGHGYCLLNPQAAAARYAQELSFDHPVIIDWDYHHGDGTQMIFAGDPSVHCISVNGAVDLYMSAIGVTELGTTAAAESAGDQNIPVLDQFYTDDFWTELGLPGRYYRTPEVPEAFRVALESLPWEPDIILVFSGYDAHSEDCGKGMQEWNAESFAEMTRLVRKRADRFDAPILSVHGGGYKLSSTIQSAVEHVQALASGHGGQRGPEPE